MDRDHFRAALPLLCGLYGAALFGCGDAASLGIAPREPPPFRDAGQRSPDFLTRIQEDFNNRRLVGSETNAIVDVNRGIVTLAATTFPEFSPAGAVSSYDGPTEQNGLVEAEEIIVEEQGSVAASDSIELRAEERVAVFGNLVAGRGGVTIVARQQIEIVGTITSEGPVRLLLGDDDGAVIVSGTIMARSTLAGPADVEILGRGSVEISGRITTSADPGTKGGDIAVNTYGDIVVSGPEVRLQATAELEGAAGSILLVSESDVHLADGAWLGGEPPEPLMPASIAPGGNIEIRGTGITVGDDVIIAASGTNDRSGGSILLTATGQLRTGHRALLAAGFGPIGGSVIVHAGTIEVGEASNVLGGGASAQPGLVQLRAVDAITLHPFSTVTGGHGECAEGGRILVEVGGLITAGDGSRIEGGPGNATSMCGRSHGGGAVEVKAQEAIGLEDAVVPGSGAFAGEVTISLEPSFTVPRPNLSAGSGGEVESVTIDRGEAAVGAIPRLVEVVATTPSSTEVTLLLAGSSDPDGPFDEWYPITADSNDQRLSGIADARYVRYRAVLRGRTFDAPILDYFEIDLAPHGF